MTPEQYKWNKATELGDPHPLDEIDALRQESLEQAAEISRLQGIINQHNLCHDLHGKVNAEDFAKGCIAEQRRVYGRSPHEEEISRLRASHDEIHCRLSTTIQTSNDEITRLRSAHAETLRQVGEIVESDGRFKVNPHARVKKVREGVFDIEVDDGSPAGDALVKLAAHVRTALGETPKHEV